MGLLDTETGKRRLFAVEIPVIEKYNAGRDPGYQIKLTRVGGTLVLAYQLKPAHNPYLIETRLLSSYPTVPPETRVMTPLKHCPHLLEGQTLCLWRQGSTRATSRWDPAKFALNWSTPHLIVHSDMDYRLPISEGLSMFNVLTERGVPTRFLNFPDETHWVVKPENSLVWHKEVLGWLNKYSGVNGGKVKL